MKFTMPDNPADQVRMHSAMLARVGEAKQQISTALDRIAPELEGRMKAGQDIRELTQTRKRLHLQELCLIDQERRLRGRIEFLRISSSTVTCEAGV